jgi:hypothetical protein
MPSRPSVGAHCPGVTDQAALHRTAERPPIATVFSIVPCLPCEYLADDEATEALMAAMPVGWRSRFASHLATYSSHPS